MRVGIVAGEVSGDRLGAGVLAALRERDPDLQAEGVAGPALRGQGCIALADVGALSVMGLAEVLGSLRRLRALQGDLVAHFLAQRPDVFIGIDAPDFVLHIAARLRAAGIRTVQLVSPSVWAWRPGRVRRVAAAVDLLLCVLPFEPRWYQGSGLRAVYIGHPLADDYPPLAPRGAARAALGIDGAASCLALLPGSRAQELRRHTALLLEAARLCRARRPDLQVHCAPVDAPAAARIEAARARYAPDLPLRLHPGRARELLHAADVALAASGTVTLEGMLARCPLVVAYRVSALSYPLLRLLVRTRFIALPNLLAGEALVPEYIQGRATAPNLAEAALAWLEDASRCDAYRARCAQLHAALALGANARAAAAIRELVHG